MNDRALGTWSRADKGPVAPPPVLAAGPLRDVVDAVSAWPGVHTTVHWHLWDRSRVDGIDFYLHDEELGHVHLDGAIHLATAPTLGERLVAEGVARPFRYQRGWVEEQVGRIGVAAAVELFRRNLENLRRDAADDARVQAATPARTSRV